MPILLKLWYWWIVLGLPLWVGRRMAHALSQPEKSSTWRAGKTLFFLGILVWCPYVLFAHLLGMRVPIVAVLALHFACLYGGLAIQKFADRSQLG
jgi:hypothetical protein